MRVDRNGGRLERRQPIVIVEGVHQCEMQDRRQCRGLIEAHAAPRDGILVGFGPAVGARDQLHAVGPQRVELARGGLDAHRLDVGVAGEQQVRRDRLDQARACLTRVRPRNEIEQRMSIARRAALLHHEGAAADILGHQLHGAVNDRVLHIAGARQRRVVARRPPRLPAGLERDHLACARGLLLRGPEEISKSVEHGCPVAQRGAVDILQRKSETVSRSAASGQLERPSIEARQRHPCVGGLRILT
jgi:hypothetical protein